MSLPFIPSTVNSPNPPPRPPVSFPASFPPYDEWLADGDTRSYNGGPLRSLEDEYGGTAGEVYFKADSRPSSDCDCGSHRELSLSAVSLKTETVLPPTLVISAVDVTEVANTATALKDRFEQALLRECSGSQNPPNGNPLWKAV